MPTQPSTTGTGLRPGWGACVSTLVVNANTSAVSILLPSISADLQTLVSVLQWAVTGYLLVGAAVIVTSGAMGDVFGRRRVFVARIPKLSLVAEQPSSAVPRREGGDMSRTRTSAFGRLLAALLRTRWLVRAPVWVYRVGLGSVFGSRLLMLEHQGRRSGLSRYTVLEVVDHPCADCYVVASGFGTRAQWFRNIQANPQVRVTVGRRRRQPATAHPLDSQHAGAVLRRYAEHHPRAWTALRPVFEQTLGARIDEHATTLPLVELSLTKSPGVGAPS